jgi:hypothetical protein
MWVGTKNANSTSAPTPVYQGQGSDADQAGLIKGTLYGLKVTGVAFEDRTTALGAPKGSDLPFTMVSLPDQSAAAADTRAALVTATATPFERPEDGAWDPVKKNVYYFVTTDRFDTVKNPEGINRTAATTRAVTAANPAGQVGRSRLWKLTFTDISNPEQGGKITMLLDGTEQQQMMDNIGVDARGENIIICEDTGNTDYLGKVLNYNIATGAVTTIAQFDPARFDPTVAVSAPVDQLLTVDEESSGVIDATSTLGTGWFLIALQVHASQSGELFERGQYVALFNPASAAPPAVNTTSSSAKLSANPSSPNVGAAATFTVTGTTTTGGQIAWELDWGDGTATTKSTVNSGAALSTTHTYTVMGSFKVTATGTDTLSGQKTVQTLTVLVKDTLRSGKLLLRVNFGSSGHDAAQLTGALPLATTATLAGPVTVDIGGFKKDFTLNEKGGGKDGKNAFQIFKKRKPDSISSIQAKFFCKLFDVDLLTSLADEGIINKDADRESKSIRCVVTFNGIPYDATITVTYIAKKDKKGFTR